MSDNPGYFWPTLRLSARETVPYMLFSLPIALVGLYAFKKVVILAALPLAVGALVYLSKAAYKFTFGRKDSREYIDKSTLLVTTQSKITHMIALLNVAYEKGDLFHEKTDATSDKGHLRVLREKVHQAYSQMETPYFSDVCKGAEKYVELLEAFYDEDVARALSKKGLRSALTYQLQRVHHMLEYDRTSKAKELLERVEADKEVSRLRHKYVSKAREPNP